MLLADESKFLRRMAGAIRVIAEQEPTIADELRCVADELEPPSRTMSIYPKSAVLGGSLHGRAYRPLKDN